MLMSPMIVAARGTTRSLETACPDWAAVDPGGGALEQRAKSRRFILIEHDWNTRLVGARATSRPTI